ncbi:MAG: DUF2142 domain-containing protein [Oscillospiraceae bacterium]|nr:DUF2142 domain-containing protein [Oscillospiraceae bacterium]
MDKQTIKKRIDSLKARPACVIAAGLVVLLLLSAFVIYRLRVIYMPEWLSQLQGTRVLFVSLSVLSGLFLLVSKMKSGKEALSLSFLLLILGILWTFATPPNQVPDEQTHYLRRHAMAQGQWGFDRDHVYPDDVNSFIRHFPEAHNNGYPAKVGNTMYNRFLEYREAVKNSEKADNTGIIIFQVVPYIPAAAGVFIARLAGLDALGAFYGARLGNVIFFVACAFFALRMAEKYRMLLFMLMAMPLSSFVWASANSDSFLFALMALMFASVLAEEFDTKRFVLFIITLGILSTCKMSYIVFLLLLLCTDRSKWNVGTKNRKMSRLVALALGIAVFRIMYMGMGAYVRTFSNYGAIPRTIEGTNMSEQLMFVLKNPLRYRAVFWDTLKNNSFFLFSGGILGWLDVKLLFINLATPFVALAVCFDQAPKYIWESGRKTAVFLVCSILTYAVVMTGLYLSWTPVSLPQIIGLQMRYFIPAFMGMFMAVSVWLSGRVNRENDPNDAFCAGLIYGLNIIAIMMMLRVYYIPLINAVATAP